MDQQNVWTGADSHRQTLSQGLLTCHGLKGYTADIGVKPLRNGLWVMNHQQPFFRTHWLLLFRRVVFMCGGWQYGKRAGKSRRDTVIHLNPKKSRQETCSKTTWLNMFEAWTNNKREQSNNNFPKGSLWTFYAALASHFKVETMASASGASNHWHG